MPVTTASGKVAGGTGVGDGVAVGDVLGDGDATPGVAETLGAGLASAHPARMPMMDTRVRARMLRWVFTPLSYAADQPMHAPELRRRAYIAALVFGVLLLGAGFGVPSTVEAVGPLPACERRDVYTVPRDYDDWSVTLVDWILRVEDDYVPPDLVPVSEAGVPGSGLIRAVAIDDLREMGKAAAAAGSPIGVWSPYRSYAEQVRIYNAYVKLDGLEVASTYSMPPGHSEHQLGLGVDFMSAGGGSPLKGNWKRTPAGKWMSQNAWKYGWVMSYPLNPDYKGGDDLWWDKICFSYEPWHYRYLGREVAKAVHDSGLTIREYLWQNYTMVDAKTGEPIATATPTSSPTPDPTRSPSPSPSVSPTPAVSQTTTPVAEPADNEPPTGAPQLDTPVVVATGIAVLALLGILFVVIGRRSAVS
jgi:D-alanyl-D-alanine carboxypeptidase